MKTILKTVNHHPRDDAIFFDEEPHKYYINGVCDNVSATTLIHSFGEKFDADKIIKNMMRGKNWKDSKYFGMSAEDIKQQWKDNGVEAALAGTNMHKSIENFWNGLPNCQELEDSVEFKMFLDFKKDHPELVPYRTEWEVYQEDYGICGSIDMIFINDDGTLSIYDWKRCKDIEMNNKYRKFCKEPIGHIGDTNYWHYSLQLNLYKFILESKYDKIIKSMHILCLHPNKEETGYQKIEIQDLQEEIRMLLEHHISQKKK